MHLKFNSQIDKLLDERKKYQNNVDQGVLPSFDPLTEEIRKSDWTVRDIPENLKFEDNIEKLAVEALDAVGLTGKQARYTE